MNLNDHELACLKVLAEYYQDDEEHCLYFRTIEKAAKLDRSTVRRAVRSLARKGLAELHTGLFSSEGRVAGSGYCATEQGAALITDREFEERLHQVKSTRPSLL